MSNAVDKAWEWSLSSMANGPGQTEQDKCDNAERGVKTAIDKLPALAKLPVRVFAQGSYRARTNIRTESDVDICVCLKDTFFPKYPDGLTSSDFNNRDADISFEEFKGLVQTTLNSHFGPANVRAGSKAFDVHANSYRVDADVLPAFEYRWYLSRDPNDYVLGIAFRSDSGQLVVNYPDHAYQNGVGKNDACSRRYKRIVRVLKGLRAAMEGDNIAAAKRFPSFLIESLVYNVDSGIFTADEYIPLLRDVLISVYNATKSDEAGSKLTEVNEIKPLFSPGQGWTRSQANGFIVAVWNYIGYQ